MSISDVKCPRVLDLYCGAGGAAWGYSQAGFEVVGVDIDKQPNFPFEFVWGDALDVMRILLGGGKIWAKDNGYQGDNGPGHYYGLEDFDLIHASPPCQAYALASRCRPGLSETYPKLIEPTRELISIARVPYVIENVEDARDELKDPVMLCGQWFHDFRDLEIRTYRHRLFETNFYVRQPQHIRHRYPNAKMGRAPGRNEFMHIVGHFSGAEQGKRAMGIWWMTRDELVESIPPVYTEYIGDCALKALEQHANCCVAMRSVS